VRRLLWLQRQTRELKKEFAPPPSPPDSAEALKADLWSSWLLIILFHSHGWKHSSDGPEEILRLLGIPEVVKWNWNVPAVKDAVDKLCHESIRTLQDLVERRGGKWPDDETKLFFNYELQSLYSESPRN
jgi:hypothetical protein